MKKVISTQSDLRKELAALLEKNEDRKEQAKNRAILETRDEITINFRCAHHGRGFSARFSRESLAGKYSFKSVHAIKEDVNLKSSLGAGINSKDKDFDISKISFRGWYCPWCRKNGRKLEETFVHCGSCEEYICTVRTTRYSDGSRYFRCHDGCGSEGEVGNPMTSIRTEKNKVNRSAPSNISAAPKDILPKRNFLSLPRN